MLFLTYAILATPSAFAADDDEEDDGSKYLEESEADKGKKSSRDKPNRSSEGQVREITRGFYGKSNVGAAAYLGNFAQVVNAGTYVSLGVGQDFVDTEKQSMAWEIQIQQGLHNGAPAEAQGQNGCGNPGIPCTEGDLRTYSIVALYEFSAYPTRRFGIGAHVGAGVLYSPLLIYAPAYQTDIIDNAFGGYDPGLHNAPKPVIVAGPTIEYYTKLSHFSVGLDVDVFYGIGWDLGLNGSGYLKYTF
jgi:hypothetical protein